MSGASRYDIITTRDLACPVIFNNNLYCKKYTGKNKTRASV